MVFFFHFPIKATLAGVPQGMSMLVVLNFCETFNILVCVAEPHPLKFRGEDDFSTRMDHMVCFLNVYLSFLAAYPDALCETEHRGRPVPGVYTDVHEANVSVS